MDVFPTGVPVVLLSWDEMGALFDFTRVIGAVKRVMPISLGPLCMRRVVDFIACCFFFCQIHLKEHFLRKNPTWKDVCAPDIPYFCVFIF